MGKPRIMIVDDNFVSVMELGEFLEEKDYDVVGTAVSGLEAVQLEKTLDPDLILMDIEMPGDFDGISASECILKKRYVPIIFVTGHDDEKILKKASKLPHAGYILKPFSERQIEATVKIALSSKNEEMAFSDKSYPSQKNTETQFPLSSAEWRVANLVKSGKTSKEIAKELKISKRTVDWHRINIRSKLNLMPEASLFAALHDL